MCLHFPLSQLSPTVHNIDPVSGEKAENHLCPAVLEYCDVIQQTAIEAVFPTLTLENGANGLLDLLCQLFCSSLSLLDFFKLLLNIQDADITTLIDKLDIRLCDVPV